LIEIDQKWAVRRSGGNFATAGAGILAQAGLMLALATVGHPQNARSSQENLHGEAARV
jgi:hypothetical protein